MVVKWWLVLVGAVFIPLASSSCRCVVRDGETYTVCRGFIKPRQLEVCEARDPVGVIVESTRVPACALPLKRMLHFNTVRLPRRSCHGSQTRCSDYPCLSSDDLDTFFGCRPNRPSCAP